MGIKRDPTFGPLVMFGMGGIYAEALADVSFRLAPLTHQDVEEMISEVRSAKLLSGLRGAPPADREALIDALIRISWLAESYPQISELDINPLHSSSQEPRSPRRGCTHRRALRRVLAAAAPLLSAWFVQLILLQLHSRAIKSMNRIHACDQVGEELGRRCQSRRGPGGVAYIARRLIAIDCRAPTRQARSGTLKPRRCMEDRIAVWLIRHRRLVKEDERKAQTSETVIALAIMRLLLAA